jgi:hypothetical protein
VRESGSARVSLAPARGNDGPLHLPKRKEGQIGPVMETASEVLNSIQSISALGEFPRPLEDAQA